MVRLTATLGFLAAAMVLLSGTSMAAPDGDHTKDYAERIYMGGYGQAKDAAEDAPGYASHAVDSLDPPTDEVIAQVDAFGAAAIAAVSAAAQPAFDAVDAADAEALLAQFGDPAALAQEAVDTATPVAQGAAAFASAQADAATETAAHATEDLPGAAQALADQATAAAGEALGEFSGVADLVTGTATAAANDAGARTDGAQDYANGVAFHWYRAAKNAAP